MKKFIAACVIVPALSLSGPVVSSEKGMSCRVLPKFSSQDSIGDAVLDTLRATERRITLALYGFNNTQLADELAKLAKKGIAVRLKIDTAKSSEKKPRELIGMLRSAGVQVQTVAPDGRNHNKFAVIDGSRVLTGSYNWTRKAESNWENMLIIDCPELARSYEAEWEKIK